MITDTPEYAAGWAWAKEHGPIIAELFSSKEVSTPELQKRFFQEATRRWPSKHDDLDNDLKQIAFVAGGMKAAIETLSMSPETFGAIMEAATDLGQLWRFEVAKASLLKDLQAKPKSWWSKKLGDASPSDLVKAFYVAWHYGYWPKEKRLKKPRSIWEVLIDVMGTREMEIMAAVVKITETPDMVYDIESEDDSFTIVSKPVFEGGRLIRYPGEIVG